MKLIGIASRVDNDADTKEIIKVINGYSKALDLLDDYDHRTLKKQKGKKSNKVIPYEECIKVKI